jgi:hypothetical protein
LNENVERTVDADLYVPDLLGGFPGSKFWIASRLGQIGGQSTRKARKRDPERMADSGEDQVSAAALIEGTVVSGSG